MPRIGATADPNLLGDNHYVESTKQEGHQDCDVAEGFPGRDEAFDGHHDADSGRPICREQIVNTDPSENMISTYHRTETERICINQLSTIYLTLRFAGSDPVIRVFVMSIIASDAALTTHRKFHSVAKQCTGKTRLEPFRVLPKHRPTTSSSCAYGE